MLQLEGSCGTSQPGADEQHEREKIATGHDQSSVAGAEPAAADGPEKCPRVFNDRHPNRRLSAGKQAPEPQSPVKTETGRR